VEEILTLLFATYADILTSDISICPYGHTSATYRTLPYCLLVFVFSFPIPSLRDTEYRSNLYMRLRRLYAPRNDGIKEKKKSNKPVSSVYILVP
jgi:hypothetical protein